MGHRPARLGWVRGAQFRKEEVQGTVTAPQIVERIVINFHLVFENRTIVEDLRNFRMTDVAFLYICKKQFTRFSASCLCSNPPRVRFFAFCHFCFPQPLQNKTMQWLVPPEVLALRRRRRRLWTKSCVGR